MAKAYRQVGIRLTDAEYQRYKAVKEKEGITWKQMLQRGAEARRMRKTVVVTLKYDSERIKTGKGMFHPVNIDIQLIKVDSKKALEEFDRSIENADFLKGLIKEPMLSEFFASHDEPEMSFDNFMGKVSVTVGIPDYQPTTEPEKQEVKIKKWGRL